MYETPFTLSRKPHGELDTQYKRKTILTQCCASWTGLSNIVACYVCVEMRLFFCHSTCVHSDAFGDSILERVFGQKKKDDTSYFSVLSLLCRCYATIFWATSHDKQNNVWLKENSGLVWWDRKMPKWKKNGLVCRRWTWVGMISLALGPLRLTGI